MRRTMIAVILVAGGTLVLSPGVSLAGHNGHEFETSQECIQSGSLMESGIPRCTRVGNGPWVAQYPGEGRTNFGGNGSGVGAFFVVALLFWLAPVVTAGMIASSRGQSVGLAILLGIFLSWLGVIIVYVTFKPDVFQAARNIVDDAAHRTPGAPGRSAAGRIAELDTLRRDGVITESEYTERRRAILNEI